MRAAASRPAPVLVRAGAGLRPPVVCAAAPGHGRRPSWSARAPGSGRPLCARRPPVPALGPSPVRAVP